MTSPPSSPNRRIRRIVVAIAALMTGCGGSTVAKPLPPSVPGCRINGWIQDARGKVPNAITFEPQANDESLRKVIAGINPATIESVTIESPAISLNRLVQFPNLRGIAFEGNIPLHGLPPSKKITFIYIESGRLRAIDARALAVLPSLVRLHLNIQSTDGLEKSATDVIGQLPTLQYLAFQYHSLSTADCRGLGQSRSLVELDLSAIRLGRAELEELARIATLQTLILRQASLDDESFSALDALPALKSVELQACSISDRSLQPLWSLGLEKIALSAGYSTRLTSECLTGIEQATSLKQLFIAAEGLDESGLKSIVALPAIEKVVLFREPSMSPSALNTIRQNNSHVQVIPPLRID